MRVAVNTGCFVSLEISKSVDCSHYPVSVKTLRLMLLKADTVANINDDEKRSELTFDSQSLNNLAKE